MNTLTTNEENTTNRIIRITSLPRFSRKSKPFLIEIFQYTYKQNYSLFGTFPTPPLQQQPTLGAMSG